MLGEKDLYPIIRRLRPHNTPIARKEEEKGKNSTMTKMERAAETTKQHWPS